MPALLTQELFDAFCALEPQTLCAWCPNHGRPPAVIKDGDPTLPPSHGMCVDCQHDEAAEGGWA